MNVPKSLPTFGTVRGPASVVTNVERVTTCSWRLQADRDKTTPYCRAQRRACAPSGTNPSRTIATISRRISRSFNMEVSSIGERRVEHAGDDLSSRAEAHPKLTPPIESVVEVTDAEAGRASISPP